METKIKTFVMNDGTTLTAPEWAVNRKLVRSAVDTYLGEQAVPKWRTSRGKLIYLDRPPTLFSMNGGDVRLCKGVMRYDSVEIATFNGWYDYSGFTGDSISLFMGWDWDCVEGGLLGSDIFVWRWVEWDSFHRWVALRRDVGFDNVLHPRTSFVERDKSEENTIVTRILDRKPTLNVVNGTEDVFPNDTMSLNLSLVTEKRNG